MVLIKADHNWEWRDFRILDSGGDPKFILGQWVRVKGGVTSTVTAGLTIQDLENKSTQEIITFLHLIKTTGRDAAKDIP